MFYAFSIKTNLFKNKYDNLRLHTSCFSFILDIDECIESNNLCPDPNTECVNTDGAYECVKSTLLKNLFSPPPFEKNFKKDFADDWNVPPNCFKGYKPANNSEMTTTCIDVDECREQLHFCKHDERCVNEIGSYRCENIAIFVSKIETKNLNNLS